MKVVENRRGNFNLMGLLINRINLNNAPEPNLNLSVNNYEKVEVEREDKMLLAVILVRH